MTFKERFETGERERRQIKDEMAKITDTQSQIRREMNVKVLLNIFRTSSTTKIKNGKPSSRKKQRRKSSKYKNQ